MWFTALGSRPYRRWFRDSRDWEEFVNELRWRIWSRWPKILKATVGGEPNAYIVIMGHHLAVDRTTNPPGPPPVLGFNPDRPSTHNTEEDALSREQLARLLDLVDMIEARSPKDRLHAQAWKLRYLAELNDTEVAQALDLGKRYGPRTAKKWISIVMDEIFDVLDEAPDDDPNDPEKEY